MGRLGRMVRVLDDDQLGLCQGAADVVQVGQAHGRVGRGDPDRLEPARLEGAEHLDGGEAGPVGDRPGGTLPVGLDLGAMAGVLDEAIARQLLGEQPRLRGRPSRSAGRSG